MLLVSVIIPNYNHYPFLKQRISSVLNQTYQNFEVIIMDDCSTDDSRNIIEGFRGHERISTIVYNEINSGSTFKQWEKGIAMAKGEIIWLAESDDYCEPNFLETLVPKFSSNVGIVYCQSLKCNEFNQVTGSWLTWTDSMQQGEIFHKDFKLPGAKYIKQFLIFYNTIPNASAVLFKKNVFEEVEGVNEYIKTNNDWLLWLKMLCISDVIYCSTPLNYFRYHQNSVIAKVKQNAHNDFLGSYGIILRKIFRDFVASLKKNEFEEILMYNEQQIAYTICDESLFLLKRGDVINSFKGLARAFKYDASTYKHLAKMIGLYLKKNVLKIQAA